MTSASIFYYVIYTFILIYIKKNTLNCSLRFPLFHSKVTCDSPYEFYRHDVTFIYDGSEAVGNWVKRAKDFLEKESITSTVSLTKYHFDQKGKNLKTMKELIDI